MTNQSMFAGEHHVTAKCTDHMIFMLECIIHSLNYDGGKKRNALSLVSFFLFGHDIL